MSKKLAFSWGKAEFSPKEFVAHYRSRLPMLVRVSQGVCGADNYFSFTTNETFYITHINEQRRTVVKDCKGRNLSIPVDYPVKFHEMQDGRGTARSLKDIIGSKFRRGRKLMAADTGRLQFYEGVEKSVRTDIQQVEMLTEYSDCYLVGNAIIEGEIQEQPVYIPLFVNIKLNIAEGLKHGDKQKFTEVIYSYHHQINADTNRQVPGNPEIMLYKDVDDRVETEYTYLEPRTIIRCPQATVRSTGTVRTSATASEVFSPKKDPPKTYPKPGSVRGKIQKPLPPLPSPDTEQSKDKSPSPMIQQKKADTHHPPPPLLTKPSMSVTQSELDHVKLKHVVRSQSTCDRDDYENWSQENQLQSLNQTRRVSIIEQSEYDVIPADYDSNPKVEPSKYQKHGGQWNSNKLPVHPEQVSKKVDEPKGIHHDDKEDGSGYMRVGDVPRDFKGITIKGVGSCLRLLNLSKYVDKFAEEMVDGQLLLEFHQKGFEDNFGMNPVEALRLNKFVHEGWRPQ